MKSNTEALPYQVDGDGDGDGGGLTKFVQETCFNFSLRFTIFYFQQTSFKSQRIIIIIIFLISFTSIYLIIYVLRCFISIWILVSNYFFF